MLEKGVPLDRHCKQTRKQQWGPILQQIYTNPFQIGSQLEVDTWSIWRGILSL